MKTKSNQDCTLLLMLLVVLITLCGALMAFIFCQSSVHHKTYRCTPTVEAELQDRDISEYEQYFAATEDLLDLVPTQVIDSVLTTPEGDRYMDIRNRIQYHHGKPIEIEKGTERGL